jgi:hypothetical protein
MSDNSCARETQKIARENARLHRTAARRTCFSPWPPSTKPRASMPQAAIVAEARRTRSFHFRTRDGRGGEHRREVRSQKSIRDHEPRRSRECPALLCRNLHGLLDHALRGEIAPPLLVVQPAHRPRTDRPFFRRLASQRRRPRISSLSLQSETAVDPAALLAAPAT